MRTDDTALYEEIKSSIRNKNALIVGDFNCPGINWNSTQGDQEGSRPIEIVEDSFLSQILNYICTIAVNCYCALSSSPCFYCNH